MLKDIMSKYLEEREMQAMAYNKIWGVYAVVCQDLDGRPALRVSVGRLARTFVGYSPKQINALIRRCAVRHGVYLGDGLFG